MGNEPLNPPDWGEHAALRKDRREPVTSVADRPTLVDVEAESTGPIMAPETPTGAAARMLELAGITAERLVTDAQAEAESLVTVAQAKAEAILEASGNEANQIAAELARAREEQAAELDRERATTLAQLCDEKAALQKNIAELRQLERNHRSHLHHYLTEQLSKLDASLPEPPAV
jgi:cell division septum initiation protein DivIVA